MKRSPGTIESIDSLRRRMRAIVEAVNADPQLALRAGANPLLALEELGYSLSPSLRQEAELRARFDPAAAKQLATLRAEIAGHLKGEVDLSSADDVRRALGKVGVRLPAKSPGGSATDPTTERAPAARTRSVSKRSTSAVPRPPVIVRPPVEMAPDDSRRLIEPLRARVAEHPVVAPLLRYLEIESSRPRLADRETYERLRLRPQDPDGSAFSLRYVFSSERDEG